MNRLGTYNLAVHTHKHKINISYYVEYEEVKLLT